MGGRRLTTAARWRLEHGGSVAERLGQMPRSRESLESQEQIVCLVHTLGLRLSESHPGFRGYNKA